MTKAEELKAYFKEGDLEWRVQSCGITERGPWALVLCYIQARAVQNRLDEVFGCLNWKDTYRNDGENFICMLSVKDPETMEWVTKENGASETDIEAFKGGISGAFKRVASSGFGIGRYLYDLENTYADCSTEKRQGWHSAKTREGKYIYWNTPKMLPKFLPNNTVKEEPQKLKTNPDGTIDRKEVYEQVVKPHVAEEMEKACTDSFNKISNAIYGTKQIAELEKIRMDTEYCRDWNRLKKYKSDDYEELVHVFEKHKKLLLPTMD